MSKEIKSSKIRISQFIPYYVYRFILWRLGDKKPLSAVIKITNRCNLKCKQCPWWKQNEPEQTTEQWKETLRDIKKRGVLMSIFEGGEPTLRKDLQELLDYSKELGMLTIVITNGQNDFSKYNPDFFWVSVDGLDEIYENIRTGAKFNTLLKNMKSSSVPFMSVITISNQNIHQISEMIDLFSPISTYVGFSFAYPYKDAENISLTKKQKEKAAQDILKIKKKYNNIANSQAFFKTITTRKQHYCNCDWMTLMVSPSGEIKQGCTFSVHSKPNCEQCECAVYREFDQSLKGNIEGYRFLLRVAGMKFQLPFFLKNVKK